MWSFHTEDSGSCSNIKRTENNMVGPEKSGLLIKKIDDRAATSNAQRTTWRRQKERSFNQV